MTKVTAGSTVMAVAVNISTSNGKAGSEIPRLPAPANSTRIASDGRSVSYTKRALIYCALYMTSCRTANIERLIEMIGHYDDLDTPIEQHQFSAFIQTLASTIDIDRVVTTEDEAQRRLITADLNKLASLDVESIQLPSSVEEGIVSCRDVVRARLEAIGLETKSSELFIVDKFPAPFDKFEWAAFAPDSDDERQFSIPQGVYFRRDRLRPLYSQALYAHEAIHTISGQIDPEVYVSGLEEGVAEILGTCYGGLSVLDADILKNIMVYGRHGVERAKLWSFYRDHTRQAFLLFNEFGLDGLAALLGRGRAAIHDASAKIVSGKYRELDLPRGGFDTTTRDILEFICAGFVPSHAYSPIDCLLAMHVSSGRSTKEVCEAAGVDESVGADRLGKISSESALFVMNGTKVGFSNVERLLALEHEAGISALRYVPLQRHNV